MSSTPSTTPGNQLPREHYLNATYGIRSWLLTTDHKRIALLVPCIGDLLLFHRRRVCHHDPDSPADPERLSGYAGNLQQAVHHARRGDDLFLPDPVDSRSPGKFPDTAHDRGQGSRLPQDQSFELVHLPGWRQLRSLFVLDRRLGHRLDVLHAAQQRLFQFRGYSGGDRSFHQRLLVDPDGPQFHRHHSHHARAGDDLVPACRFSFGPITPPASSSSSEPR